MKERRSIKIRRKYKPLIYGGVFLLVFFAILGISSNDDKNHYQDNSEQVKTISSENNKEANNNKTKDISAESALNIDYEEESPSFNINEVPAYSGSATTTINDGTPFFTKEDLNTNGEIYSDLDTIGRCGVCIALVGPETLPTGSREGIGSIKPTGWETVKYEGIDGNYLYNRCHLIGWQLTGENVNPQNLITGTRYMNTQGMEPIEKIVAAYVLETGNHVLYRSTPIFEGDNLLASGVLLEAQSIEDDAIKLNVYCYNVQPGIIIDYATGKSQGPEFIGGISETETNSTVTRQTESVEENDLALSQSDDKDGGTKEVAYIGNANSHKFHKTGCSSVKDMKEKNKVLFYGDRQEVIDEGYTPCGKCNP